MKMSIGLEMDEKNDSAVFLPRLGVFFQILPLILFIAFFFPNTRVESLSGSMLIGRWIILFLVAGFVLLRWFMTSDYSIHSAFRHLSLKGSFILAFLWCGTSIVESVNPPLALAKWTVFVIFLLICSAYSGFVQTREEILSILYPFALFFIFYIWLTPAGVFYFPQPLRGDIGYINGFMVFAPALGHFLASFGVPSLLFMMTRAERVKFRAFLGLTLLGGLLLIFKSGSRSAAFTTAGILTIALLRWKGDERLSFLKGTLICVLAAAVISFPNLGEFGWGFLMKYPETELLSSREEFWGNALRAFWERPHFGYGFGVQEQLQGMPVGFFSIGWREQGSTFYGLLEEVGIVGAFPLFVAFFVMGWRCARSVLFSQDPLEIFFSQVVLVGLGLAAFENYLVYLGNATSILVFLAFFLRERLLSLSSPDPPAPATVEEGSQMEPEGRLPL